MKSLVVALVLAAFPLAASAVSVSTDSDPSVNLASYKTYYWVQKPNSGAPLIDQRIVADVDAQLQAKGFTQAADGDGDGDVAVSANVSTSEKQSLNTFYNGPAMGGWGWRGGWGGMGWGNSIGMANTTTTVSTYQTGTLVVDMFDTKTKEAIWRGTATGAVPSSSAKQNKVVDSSIVKMFAKFPASAAAK